MALHYSRCAPVNTGSISSRLFFCACLRPRERTRAQRHRHLSWGSHFLYAYGFRIYFTPLPGFFSPFPHGTGSLSVDHEYLALEDGPLWPDFPDRSANKMAKDCWLFRFRSPLLSESRLISVPCPTEMFQFRQFAPLSLWIRPRVTLAGRVSPFGNPRIKACLPAPRGLSQATTSFVACDRQGIHHMHLFA